jgi:hypothetical protein
VTIASNAVEVHTPIFTTALGASVWHNFAKIAKTVTPELRSMLRSREPAAMDEAGSHCITTTTMSNNRKEPQ